MADICRSFQLYQGTYSRDQQVKIHCLKASKPPKFTMVHDHFLLTIQFKSSSIRLYQQEAGNKGEKKKNKPSSF